MQEHCLAHWSGQHSAAPCVEVHVDDAADAGAGYAVLADRKGGAHFLLIPTRTITGIESPVLDRAGRAELSFRPRGRAHERLDAVVGQQVPTRFIGLAVNPLHARSQDQLHIHIECLRPDVTRPSHSRRRTSRLRGRALAPRRLELLGAAHRGRISTRRIPSSCSPQHFPDADRAMGDYTLVVAGAAVARIGLSHAGERDARRANCCSTPAAPRCRRT